MPSLDGKDRCKYTRQIFVQKGQRVKIGEPVKVSFFRQVAPGATLMYEDILYACDEDVCPEYTKDPRKLLLCLSLDPPESIIDACSFYSSRIVFSATV